MVELLSQDYVEREVWLIHVTEYLPVAKQYRKDDVPLLQFALINIINELMEIEAVRGSLVQVEHDVLALFLHPEQKEGFINIVEEKIHHMLGISASAYEGGFVDSPQALRSAYENSGLHLKRPTEKNEWQKEDFLVRETMKKRIEQWKLKLLSIIYEGMLSQLHEEVEQAVDKIQTLYVKKAKEEAFAISFALHSVTQKVMTSDGSMSNTTMDLNRIYQMQYIDDVHSWLQKNVANALERLEEWLEQKK